MKILFLHNNFPGQYRRIVTHLQDRPGVEMIAGTLASNQQRFNVKRIDYTPHREPTKGIHPTIVTTERAVITAQAAFKALYPLKNAGWSPDLVCAHSGWGPSLLMKELWPRTKMICLFEWFYNPRGSDADFFGEPSHDAAARTQFKNLPILMDYAAMDFGTSPTRWQWGQFPQHMRGPINVLHEGVDCTYFTPGEDSVSVGERTFTADDEVITYVARGMEPYRGFPQFMEMVSKIQTLRPNLHVLIAGDDRVAYGRKRDDGKTYKEHALETLDLDLSRVHFLGLVPLSTLRAMFRITRAHIYLSAPFVLSWSMLEAMATGALVIGSRTAPVEEVIFHGENGLLINFFNVDEQVDTLLSILHKDVESESLKQASRETILQRYDLQHIMPRQRRFYEDVARGEQPELSMGLA
ncbi:MAG: glycosyltransferase [Pseudomonadota bacterium]